MEVIQTLCNHWGGGGGSLNDYVIFDWHPNDYRGEGGGSGGAKMWLRNIWMLPNMRDFEGDENSRGWDLERFEKCVGRGDI